MKHREIYTSYVPTANIQLDFSAGGNHQTKCLTAGGGIYDPNPITHMASLIDEGERIRFQRVRYIQRFANIARVGGFSITPVLLMGSNGLTVAVASNTNDIRFDLIIAGLVTAGNYHYQVLPTVFPTIGNDQEIVCKVNLNLTKVFNYLAKEFETKEPSDRSDFRLVYIIKGLSGQNYVGGGVYPTLIADYTITQNKNVSGFLK